MKKQKKKIRINSGRLITTVIIVVLIAFLVVSLKNVISLHYEQSQLKEENSELKSNKSSLNQELKNVNDSNYIEEQARIQLRLIKPGEILYILGDKAGTAGKNNSNTDNNKGTDEEATN